MNTGVIEALISSDLLVTLTELVSVAQQAVERPVNSNKIITFDNDVILLSFSRYNGVAGQPVSRLDPSGWAFVLA